MNYKKIGAIFTHIYTGSGILLAFWAALALYEKNITVFLFTLSITVIIDATDGTMARYFNVKKNAPIIDGTTMDNIVDFITYTFLPILALPIFGILPVNLTWVAFFPLGASLYGFSQTQAKADASFVGFPSYWNVLFLYLYILRFPIAWTILITIFLSFMTFVPIRYLYPSRTSWLQKTTLLLTTIWGGVVIALCLDPDAVWAKQTALYSLIYPVYYAVVSLLYHRQITKKNEELAPVQVPLTPANISVEKE